jgi:hypothetical protein
MAEAQEAYKVETFARKIGVTRQVLVNDDLGASPISRGVWDKRRPKPKPGCSSPCSKAQRATGRR